LGCSDPCGGGTVNRERMAIDQMGESCQMSSLEKGHCNIINPCRSYPVWIDTSEMTTGYCFDDYNETMVGSGFENAADELGTLVFDPHTVAGDGFEFNDDFGGIKAEDSGQLGAILTPNLGTTQTDKTLAMLIMHYNQDDQDILETDFNMEHSTRSIHNANEIFQQNAIVISSGPFPDVRIEVYDGNTLVCQSTFHNVYSRSEFVLVVVTVDGQAVSLYKNGKLVGADQCSHRIGVSTEDLHIGHNHFQGVVRSFAVWDRALDPQEIERLDVNRLLC